SFSRMSTGPGRRMPFRRPRRAADKKLKRAICSKRVIRACRPSVTEKPESDLAGARERGEGGAVGLPAPRAVAVTHVLERAGDLVADRPAETATSDHALPPLSSPPTRIRNRSWVPTTCTVRSPEPRAARRARGAGRSGARAAP